MHEAFLHYFLCLISFQAVGFFFHNLPIFSEAILLLPVFLIVSKAEVGSLLADMKKATPSTKRRPTHAPRDSFTRFVITFHLSRYP
jgi:hypothetical protein